MSIPEEKVCSKCILVLSMDDFNKDIKGKYGRSAICRECRKIYRRANSERTKEYNAKYQKENVEKIKKLKEDYREGNKEKIAKYHKEYCKNRYNNDIEYKIGVNLRRRVSKMIRREQRAGSAVRDLGCTLGYFKKHIESMFDNKMKWDNYGEWHIDHIKPLSKFNLSNREQFLEAANYKNLQPLWAADNIRKGNKI